MAPCTLIRTPKGVGGAVKTKGYEKPSPSTRHSPR